MWHWVLYVVDGSVRFNYIQIKSDWKSPVGAGPLAMPEALRISWKHLQSPAFHFTRRTSAEFFSHNIIGTVWLRGRIRQIGALILISLFMFLSVFIHVHLFGGRFCRPSMDINVQPYGQFSPHPVWTHFPQAPTPFASKAPRTTRWRAARLLSRRERTGEGAQHAGLRCKRGAWSSQSLPYSASNSISLTSSVENSSGTCAAAISFVP